MRTLRKKDIESMARELQVLRRIEEKSIVGGVSVFILTDSIAISTQSGTSIYYLNGCTLYLSGVQMSTNMVTSGAAYQFNGTIHINPDVKWSASDIIHEYGHYIQQQEMGTWGYMTDVAIPSLWSAARDPENHDTKWFEKDATEKGNDYANTNQLCPDDDTGNFYANDNGVSGYMDDISGYIDDTSGFMDDWSGYVDSDVDTGDDDEIDYAYLA
jgi:hypothetical protein